MNGYIILFALLIICDSIVAHFNLVIPGSILGLATLFIFFLATASVPSQLADAARTLLKLLPLLLIPVGAAIKELLSDIDSQLALMLGVSILSLLLAVLITVGTYSLVRRRQLN